MAKGGKLATKASAIFDKYGRKAAEIAREIVLDQEIEYEPVREALRYFIEKTWYGAQHSALLSLSCQAVGGREEDTLQVGAAVVLLAGAVDMHDDIIDKSEKKGSRSTVLGKFGVDLTLLAGDALLFKGLKLLHEACKRFTPDKERAILNLAESAFYRIGNAEAKETSLRNNLGASPQDCLTVIKMKSAVAKAQSRIGAIVGGGSPREIDAMGEFGEALGTLTTLRDEFIDMFEPDELANRLKNECLPLPILYALQDKDKKEKLLHTLHKERITEKDAYSLVDLVWEMAEVQNLRNEMYNLKKGASNQLKVIQKTNPRIHKDMALILAATTEDLE